MPAVVQLQVTKFTGALNWLSVNKRTTVQTFSTDRRSAVKYVSVKPLSDV